MPTPVLLNPPGPSTLAEADASLASLFSHLLPPLLAAVVKTASLQEDRIAFVCPDGKKKKGGGEGQERKAEWLRGALL